MVATAVLAQDAPLGAIHGKVVNDSSEIEAIHVLNITALKATITDAEGYFRISAQENDTLVFSGVNLERKHLVVTREILDSPMITVPLHEQVTRLNEVVVMPYMLTGDMGRDLAKMDIGREPVTAASLGLPNAYVRPPTKTERELFEATSGGGIPLTPMINAITGRTKRIKERLAHEKTYDRTLRVQAFYPDSVIAKAFQIPEEKVPDFMYFCEVDAGFQEVVDSHDRLGIWEFMREKSEDYRRDNPKD